MLEVVPPASHSDSSEPPWTGTWSDDTLVESVLADSLDKLPLYHPFSTANAFAGHAVSMLEEIDMIWQSSDFSSKNDLDTSEIQQDYFLRRRAHDYIPSTNVDQDTSGNYDPDSERAIAIRPAKVISPTKDRTKAKDGSNDDQADRPSPRKMSSLLAARQRGASQVYSFRLSRETCQQFKDAGHVDNWPDVMKLYEKSLDTPHCEAESSNPDQSASSICSGRRLRSKAQRIDLSKREEDYEHMKHHPAARGCKCCFAVKMKCPLLDPEQSWPCHLCSEDGIYCELLLPPRRKAACERCTDQGLDCSYLRQDQDHAVDCVACAATGAVCRAGPAHDLHKGRLLEDGSLPRSKRRPRANKVQRRRSQRKPKARAEELSAEIVEDSDIEDGTADIGGSDKSDLAAEPAQDGSGATSAAFTAATAATIDATTDATTAATTAVTNAEMLPQEPEAGDFADVCMTDADLDADIDDFSLFVVDDRPGGQQPAKDHGLGEEPEATGHDPETESRLAQMSLLTDADKVGTEVMQEVTPAAQVDEAEVILTGTTQHDSECSNANQPLKRKNPEQDDEPHGKRLKVDGSTQPTSGNPATIEPDIIEIVDSDDDDEEPVPDQFGYLTTRWAHPMKFMMPSSQDCLWCHTPALAALGLEPRRLKVRKCWPNGARGMPEHHEAEAGYGVDGYNTNMCNKCTLLRINIAGCWHGKMREIDKDQQAASLADSIECLGEGRDSAEVRTESYKWCFVCAEPATFECAREGSKARPGLLHEEHSDARGCGLRVCSLCRNLLNGFVWYSEYRPLRVLDLLKLLPKLPETIRELGYRADFELLKDMRPLLRV